MRAHSVIYGHVDRAVSIAELSTATDQTSRITCRGLVARFKASTVYPDHDSGGCILLEHGTWDVHVKKETVFVFKVGKITVLVALGT